MCYILCKYRLNLTFQSWDCGVPKVSVLRPFLVNNTLLAFFCRRLAEEEDELSEVEPDAVPPEVREWLASTFTRQLSGGRRKNDEKPKFRLVNYI